MRLSRGRGDCIRRVVQGRLSEPPLLVGITSLPACPHARSLLQSIRIRRGQMSQNTIRVVNLAEKFAQIDEPWQPRIAGESNDTHVKLAKPHGEFVWHHHENEDELFDVVKGRLCIKLRDRDLWVGEGEFVIIPRGVEHKPVAEDEVHVLLLESRSTFNTGNVLAVRFVVNPKWY